MARLGDEQIAIITACEIRFPTRCRPSLLAASHQCPALRALCDQQYNIIIGASIGDHCRHRPPCRRCRRHTALCRHGALPGAKNEGRNRACIYDATMDADLFERANCSETTPTKPSRTTKSAPPISRSRTPAVRAGDGIVGVEALARWTHAVLRYSAVALFRSAENSGLIVELGEYDAAARLFRIPALAEALCRRQRFAAAIPPLGLRRTWSSASSPRPNSTPTGSNSNSPKARCSAIRRNRRNVDAAAQGDRRALCARRFRHRLFEPALSAPLPVRQAQDRFELRCARSEKAPDVAAIVHAVVSLRPRARA